MHMYLYVQVYMYIYYMSICIYANDILEWPYAFIGRNKRKKTKVYNQLPHNVKHPRHIVIWEQMKHLSNNKTEVEQWMNVGEFIPDWGGLY